MDIHQIMKKIPHRYPILLIDRVLEIEVGKRVKALKNVTINEPFFLGHFPHRPVMPGVMILEAMAQAAALLAVETAGASLDDKMMFYFAGVDGSRFKRPVEPGDQLILEVELDRTKSGIFKFKGKAWVGKDLAAEAELMCTCSAPVPAVLLAPLLIDLQNRFSNLNSTLLSDLLQHGREESPLVPASPDFVVYAQSTVDVVLLLQRAHVHKTSVIPYGAGSSLEGHALAVLQGISLDVNRMNEILEIRAEDQLVRAQPGVTRIQFNDVLRDTGLFSVNPGANASIGGMCTTSASGTDAVRYGTMRQNVLVSGGRRPRPNF